MRISSFSESECESESETDPDSDADWETLECLEFYSLPIFLFMSLRASE